MLSLFNFERDDARSRLIGLLIPAVFMLFLLLFRLTTYVDQNQRSIRQLVEALALAPFDFASVPRKTDRPRIVVVSAFNEAENIGAVALSMPATLLGHEVLMLVIDDGSSDGTGERPRLAARTWRNPIRRAEGSRSGWATRSP